MQLSRRKLAHLVLIACILATCAKPASGETVVTEPIRVFGLGTLEAAAYSPDGRHIATCGSGGAFLWDVQTGNVVRTFREYADDVLCVAFSPDGSRLLTGNYDGKAKLRDSDTGECIRTFSGHKGEVRSVAFSPDGTRVLTGSEDWTAKLWDVDTGECIRTFGGQSVHSVAFSPDGTKVLTGGSTANLWDAATGACIRTFSGPGWSVAFSPDGTKVLTGGSAGMTAKLWDAATGECIRTFSGHTDSVGSVAFSPDGTKVLTGAGNVDNTAKLWNAATGECIRTFSGHNIGGVRSVAFSPDGTKVLTRSNDQTAKLWDPDTGECIRTFSGHIGSVGSVAFSPDGSRVLTGDCYATEGTAKMWDADTGECIRTFGGFTPFVTSVAFSPDATMVLTGSGDSTARLWDAVSGECIRTFTGPVVQAVTSVAFSPDGTKVLTGTDDATARLWDATTGACGACIRTFTGHREWVNSVAFSPDGTKVLTGSDDFTAKLWDAATGACIRTFIMPDYDGNKGDVWSVAFSPDGTKVLTGDADDSLSARLWDTATGECIRTFTGGFRSVAFSPDGSGVLVGGEDGTAKLWNASSGACVRTFICGVTGVAGVAFSPDGSLVLTGSGGMAKLWDSGAQLLVRSTPVAGVRITGDPTGVTDFAILFTEPGQSRTLTAPPIALSGAVRYDFVRWEIDGQPQPSGQLSVQFTVGNSMAAIAVYEIRKQTLTVLSSPIAGLSVTGTRPGTTGYAAICDEGETVNLSALATATLAGQRCEFLYWTVDGIDGPSRQTSVAIVMDMNHAATAQYRIARTLTVLSAPVLRVNVTGLKPGATNYVADCEDQQAVQLTAPSTVTVGSKAYPFVRWFVDGEPKLVGQRDILVTMDKDHAALAQYELPLPGDINDDCIVNVLDLIYVRNRLNTRCSE